MNPAPLPLIQTVLFIRRDHGCGIMVADEYDGEASRIVNQSDPFEPAL